MKYIEDGKVNIQELLKHTGNCKVSEINEPNYKKMAKALINLRDNKV